MDIPVNKITNDVNLLNISGIPLTLPNRFTPNTEFIPNNGFGQTNEFSQNNGFSQNRQPYESYRDMTNQIDSDSETDTASADTSGEPNEPIRELNREYESIKSTLNHNVGNILSEKISEYINDNNLNITDIHTYQRKLLDWQDTYLNIYTSPKYDKIRLIDLSSRKNERYVKNVIQNSGAFKIEGDRDEYVIIFPKVMPPKLHTTKLENLPFCSCHAYHYLSYDSSNNKKLKGCCKHLVSVFAFVDYDDNLSAYDWNIRTTLPIDPWQIRYFKR